MAHAFTNTGYKPPKPEEVDPRNFDLAKAQPIAPFPSSYKTDISMLYVFDQSKIPDCVENAITLVKMFHDYKNVNGNNIVPLSRRFLAIQTVKRDGFPLDEGTNIQNALYVSHAEGISETQYCDDNHELPIAVFADPKYITPSAVASAITRQTFSYAFVKDKSINGLKNAIYQNGLVIVGGRIDDNWWTNKNGQVSWAKSDIYPIRPPESNSDSKSNHAFVLYGYDDNGFYLRNSFGIEWADQGNNYIPNSAMGIIYEAATIVDLTAAQITALKNAQNDLNQVNGVIHNLDPKNPNYGKIVGLLGQVGGLIVKMLSSIFQK